MNYWLVKQEPEEFSWSELVREGDTSWTGVRNAQARNYLQAMELGDVVLFYHSGKDKMIVGVAKVTRRAYPDRTADEGDWLAVNIAPHKSLPLPISLGKIKADPILKDMTLVKQSRLSVMPVVRAHVERIAELAQTRI
jgi:predicted RNA-binding protein with PUA-like domain